MKKIILTISVFGLAATISIAQTTHILRYGMENGLPQSQVQTLMQDEEGNLWVGTMSGLSMYDGTRFKTFTKDDSLAENWISSSLKDSKGNLWFGHRGGGVSKYSASERKFRSLDFDIISGFKPVTAIMEDKEGNFWFGTDGAGIYRYGVAKNQVVVVSSDEELSSDNVTAICQDNSGNIWIGTDNGITIYDPNYAINDEEGYSYLNIEQGLQNNKITALTLVYGDEMWIGTEDAGIIIIKLMQGSSIHDLEKIKDDFSAQFSTSGGLASGKIKSLTEHHDGSIWIGTADKGVIQYTPSSKERTQPNSLIKGILKSLTNRQGLNYDNVNCIISDREGNIWIGTNVGLNQYRSDRFLIYDESDGIINNVVWSSITDSRQYLWLATNEGVTRIIFNNGEKQIKNYTKANGLGDNVIVAIAEDNDGNIWFGTAKGGASVWHAATDKITTLSASDGLADNSVNTVAVDNSGKIWFGTRKGASQYDPATGIFRNYSSKDGLGAELVYRIFKDSKGKLWISTLGGYLNMYDGNSFKSFGEAEGIKHKFLLSSAEDKEGNLWFGAYGGGFYKYDGSSFTYYSKDDGLQFESPASIICADNGIVWFGTSKGIIKFDKTANKFYDYGKPEGFLGIETNANAVCKDLKGAFWFGTIMGAVRFDPSKDIPNTEEPVTTITGLNIRLEPVEMEKGLVLKYDLNHVTFNFKGVCLTNPGKVRYKYKLEGFDDDWGPITKVNSVTYSNLPHGEFNFMVMAMNDEGIWNKVPAGYSFRITPPFWKTWWFITLSVIFSATSFYLFVKIRTASLIRQKIILEDKVKERTIELAHKNKELAEKNNDITASIRYAKRIQQAILPPEANLAKHFPESFILFLPKDIVSGDFYFIQEKNGRLVYAAVDCTGHGVPGAFMSIIGHNMLDNAINKQNLTKAGEILDNLNTAVISALRQSVADTSVKDGMDISLCSIDLKSKKVDFAAAFNPLYRVKNGKLEEIKADKQPIGAASISDDGITNPYTNNEFTLNGGESLYVFSDGFHDQFGGPKGKKFMTRNFKELFIEMQQMSMKEQKEHLHKTLITWRGDQEQVDDILVIGIKN